MGQYITRNLPVISATFGSNLLDGQPVCFNPSGYVVAITSSIDPYIGVAANSDNAVDGYTNSGSVGNVILRGSGMPCKVYLEGTVAKGVRLVICDSGSFVSGKYDVTGSNSLNRTSLITCDAYALQAGVKGDIIDGFLK